MSQVLGYSNRCKHGIEPRIVCDICFPPLTDKSMAAIAQGRTVAGESFAVLDKDIRCEIDGEPIAGVKYLTVEFDRDNKVCVMIFTNPTFAEYLEAIHTGKTVTVRDDDHQS